jgi:hypothetical protein
MDKTGNENLTGGQSPTSERKENTEYVTIQVSTAMEVFIAELGKLNTRVGQLETVCIAQQVALQELDKVLKAHQKSIEALTGYQPPAPGTSMKN